MAEDQNIEYKKSWRDEYLKWICGFANAQGGKLYIGIDDDKRIVGVENSHRLLEDIPNKIATTMGIVCDVNLRKKDGKEYIEIIVEPSNVPIAYKGEYHTRSGATKQQLRGTALQLFILKKMGMSWDDIPHPSATIECIDEEAVKYFVEKAIDAERLSPSARKDSVEKVLHNLELIDDENHLKNAAILLFGKKPQHFFGGVEFKIGRFVHDNTDLIIQDAVTGNILQMADEVISILRSKYLISPIHYEGMVRKEPLEIPDSVLREAIYNAIVHKDYSGVSIQMKVWNDRIELWNDGTLPEGYTIETLLSEHSSKARNKNIANVFYMAGFIETWGRGIDKIRNGLKDAHLPEPSFQEYCGGLRVTIPRAKLLSDLLYYDTQKLSARQKKILNMIRKDIMMSGNMLSARLGVSLSTVRRDIKALTKMGVLQYAGSSKDGHWEILKEIGTK